MQLLQRAARALSSLGPGRAGAIGLTVAGGRIELLQLGDGGPRPRVRAALSIACEAGSEALLESPADLERKLAAGLRRHGFRGRRVVTALPAGRVKLMVLNYSLEAGREESDLILSLVAERVEQPLEDCIVDYLPIRTSGEKHGEKSALVAVAQREGVIRYLEALRGAGLHVEALEIEPVAVRRLVMRLSGGSTQENMLILNGGATRSDLTVFWGRRLILYREVDFSESAAIGRLSRTLELSPESAASMLREYGFSAGTAPAVPLDPVGSPRPHEIAETVREILKADLNRVAESVRNALAYTASQTRGGSVETIYLLGCLVRWPGVDRLLEELLSLPVQILDPTAAFDADATAPATARDADPAPSAVVVGLALRGIGDEP